MSRRLRRALAQPAALRLSSFASLPACSSTRFPGRRCTMVAMLAATWAAMPVVALAQAGAEPGGGSGGAARSAATMTLPAVTVKDQRLDSDVTEGSGSYTARRLRSATGLDLAPRETPQSVTVVTRQQMDDQAVTSLNDVLMLIPGVARQSYGALDSGYVSYYARGFEINNFLIDGVVTSPLSMEGLTGIGTRDMAIYDRVVAVRGATGLLTGAGDPSASIDLVRKRPSHDFQGSASLLLGRWDQRRLELDLSTPFDAAGRVRGRFVVAREDYESWMARAEGDRTTVYAVVETDLAPMTTLRGGIEYGRQRSTQSSMHGFNYADTAGNRTRLSGFDNPTIRSAYMDLDRTTVFANLEHGFGNGWDLRFAVNHTRLDYDQVYGVAAQNIQAGTNATGVTYGRAVDTPTQNAIDFSASGPFELFGREHQLVLGGNYYRATSDDPAYQRQTLRVPDVYAFDPGITGQPFVSPGRDIAKDRQGGLYAAARWRPSDALSLITGARVSTYRSYTQSPSSTQDSDESGVITPYLGAVYDLSTNWSPYASYTRIFRPQSSRDVSGNRLDPERGSNVELGMKGSFGNGALNVSAALFQTRKDNLAVQDGDKLTPNGDQAYRAADDTKARGYEVELSGQLAPGWQIGAGYTRVVIKDSVGEALSTDFIPKHLFKLFGTWQPAAIEGLTLGGGAMIQSAVMVDSSYTEAQRRQYREGGRTLWNLMARYELSRNLDLTLNLQNLSDKRYRSQVTQHNIGAPRHLMASVRYKF